MLDKDAEYTHEICAAGEESKGYDLIGRAVWRKIIIRAPLATEQKIDHGSPYFQ